jgi:hypothetical protein
MTDVPAHPLLPAVHIETGEAVLLWDGAGRVVNDQGDLYGTSPYRIIRSGKIVIDGIRVAGAIAAGWRLLEKAWPDASPGSGLVGAELCDPDFAWIERPAPAD